MMAVEDKFPTFHRIGAWIISIPKALLRLTPRIWRPVLAVLLLLAAAHGVATFVLGRRVEAEIRKIKARGEFMSMADLAGPKIPDAENGAVVCRGVQDRLISRLKGDNKEVVDLLSPRSERNTPNGGSRPGR